MRVPAAVGAVGLLAPLLVSPLRDSAPAALLVATARGVEAIRVSMHYGHPALAAQDLERLLPVSARRDAAWADVAFARQQFRFLLDAPVLEHRGAVRPLVGGAYVARDTLYLPMQWLVGIIPSLFGEAYRYDPIATRFEELRVIPVATRVSGPGRRVPPEAAALGLRSPHRVVIDAGHGGRDVGTSGRYLPRGVQEKQVALAISLLVEQELKKRGIEVVMTRRTDVLVDYRRRARTCGQECDAFVSIHVNSLPDSPRNRTIRGVETYFWREALTAEAARVAAIENESLRYETGLETTGENDPLAFILKDLERNEYLRESADFAAVVHGRVSGVHPGGAARSRGMEQADFAVLREAIRPAILLETGYASNSDDGRFLASNSGQRQLASAIADGIIDYLRRYEERTLSPSPPR